MEPLFLLLYDWYIFEVSFYVTTKRVISRLEQSFVEFIYNRMNQSYDLIMTNSMDIADIQNPL